MTEATKTLTFAGTALAVLLLALFVSRPQHPGEMVLSDSNEKLFPKFDDPLVAKSLEIIDYDEETGQRSVFEVEQNANGVWSIPSHGGYPADAQKQLAEAGASIIDVKKGTLESNDPSSQVKYGVVEPPDSKSKSERGLAGVGKQVTFKDKGGSILAQFIIGKEAKVTNAPKDPHSMEPQGPRVPLRYVRVPGKDAIYSTAVKIDKLSTRFDDWIEKDLLKMKMGVYNIKEVMLKNDTVNLERRKVEKGPISELQFDSKTSVWTPIELKMVDALSGQLITRKLTADEEIDNQKLNDMKNALNDLRIADVQRKPAGLSADLQASPDFVQSQQAAQSLAVRGFYALPEGESIHLYSKEGEVRCSMNDGVEYVLRFGNIAGRGKAEDLEDDKPADDKPAETKKTGDDGAKKDDADKSVEARRFLFVAVEFNPDMVAKPQLEALPPEEAKPEDKKSEGKPEAKKDDKEADEKKVSEKKEADKKEPEDKSGDETQDDKKTDERKTDEGTEEKKQASERERIEKANQSKQEEYDKQVKKGEERVAELNRRFADWYYVIPDKTYQKIHLTQADIIKKKAPPADQATPGTGGLPPNGGDPFMQKILGGQAPPQSPATQTTPATTPPAGAKTTPAAPKTPQAPAKNTTPKKPVETKK